MMLSSGMGSICRVGRSVSRVDGIAHDGRVNCYSVPTPSTRDATRSRANGDRSGTPALYPDSDDARERRLDAGHADGPNRTPTLTRSLPASVREYILYNKPGRTR